MRGPNVEVAKKSMDFSSGKNILEKYASSATELGAEFNRVNTLRITYSGYKDKENAHILGTE